MTIEINNSKTIQQIQLEFTSRYPDLKLEFFRNEHGLEEASNETPCQPEKTIGELRDLHEHGLITITPDRETGSVEREFEQRFGLHVQIYRKRMDQWLQTIGTDILTLEQQSKIARDTSTFYNPNHRHGSE